MKVLKLLVLSVLLMVSFTSTMQADEKIILRSGDVYSGQIIEESDAYIKLNQINTDIKIEIEKSQIEKIEPALCRIVTDTDYEIYGNIIERQRMMIKVRTSDGVIIDVDRSDILSIEYVNENEFNDWSNPVPTSRIRKIEKTEETESSQVNNNRINGNQPNVQNDTYSQYYEQTFNQNFPYVGITLGTPGIFNAAFGYHLDNVILELKGGASDEYAGVQGSMLLNIYETDDGVFGMGLGLNLGYMSHKRKDDIRIHYDGSLIIEEINYHDNYAFTGATFRIQWYGVTFDIGVATSIMNDNYYVDESFPLANLGYMYYFN